MAYLEDTGNNDARTEGMSYGMMMCVQLDWKAEFDRIWKWAKTYMWMEEGENEGYFAWSCKVTGEKNSHGPAPDGEEFFAMALFFALPQMGRRRGDFRVFQTGEGYPEGLPSQGGERKSRRAHVESGERTDSVRSGE